MNIYNYATVISAVLLVLLILIQTRGASLGAGLGGAGEVNIERRGSEKSLHQITIILVIIFAVCLVLGVVA